MTDVLMLPVSILAEYSLRNEVGSAACEWASAGEGRALPFFNFRHCLTKFSFDSFAHIIRQDPSIQWWWWIWRIVLGGWSKKSRRILPFSPFRSCSVVNGHSIIECRFFLPFRWLLPFYIDYWRYSRCWEEDLCGCGGITTDDGDMVSFLDVFAWFSIWFYEAI